MPIFGRRRSAAPRLAPELDDAELGRVCRQLTAPRVQGQLDLSAGLVEQVLKGAGQDWDRRTHRFGVLAGAGSVALAKVWRRQRPQDADALLFHAWTELAHGIPDGPAGTVEKLRRAADLLPGDPLPWLGLLRLGRLLALPEREIYPLCREIGARDAWNRTAHLELLGYLSPEECGSHAQVLEFVESVRVSAPADSPVAGLELTMLVERYRAAVAAGGVTAIGARHRWTRPDAESALARAVADWPRPGYLTHSAAVADLNLLAYALVQANRAPEAAEAFAAIGTTVTTWPWTLQGDPLQEFGYWRDQAL
ncbi:hypothetical protein [Kitasatospora sp. McL0602]|uniref:hypothetical protein n=1 Tax=Kitasatospora sp. McL0602 TaxID=3439530 RepID=UPI003F8A8884